VSDLILVTGAAGFIGSHVCDGLLAAGYRVRGVDNLSFGRLDNLARARENPDFDFVQAELSDLASCFTVCEEVQAVLHHAARVGVPESFADPDACSRDTVHTTFNLLEAAANAGARRFVLASTAAVYGEAPCPVAEDAPREPFSPYGEFKESAEMAVSIVREVDGVSLRYFNVYGERQDPRSPYAGVIAVFADRLRRGLPLTIYGNGRQTRDFIHVSDIVRANLAALQARSLYGRAINIGTGRGVDLITLARTIGAILGREPQLQFEEEREGDIPNSWADVALAQELLQFKANVTLEQGLRELLTETS
jgi:UDP-glucose 4-epimerase